MYGWMKDGWREKWKTDLFIPSQEASKKGSHELLEVPKLISWKQAYGSPLIKEGTRNSKSFRHRRFVSWCCSWWNNGHHQVTNKSFNKTGLGGFALMN
jgi:hypothetical protein